MAPAIRVDRLKPVSQIEPKRCTLRLATGVVEFCPQQRCAFWEEGGAVVEGGCVIERLGLDVRRSDVAGYLVEVRERLDQARDRSEAEAAHREVARRIGLGL
jgi:hypothetical protein